MFGEHDSESPRVGSPWDSLLAAPPALLKLAPEVEEGNVEYKLKLITPTPERFARLVTQLKWRLLEGGGQALYELGVADDGALIGLPRSLLECSLHTLEEMAGEIGASVIIVKEIDIPLALARGIRQAYTTDSSSSSDYSTPTTDTEPSASDSEDFFAPWLAPALFEVDDSTLAPVCDLEIAAVYKPRPTRRRPPALAAKPHTLKNASKQKPDKKPSPPPHRSPVALPAAPVDHVRRGTRDRRRVEKRRDADAGTEVAPTGSLPQAEVVKNKAALHELDVPGDSLSNSAATLMPNLSAFHVTDPLTPSFDVFLADDDTEEERRLIVEVLVVRKMSLEEVFLDFGGFSVEV